MLEGLSLGNEGRIWSSIHREEIDGGIPSEKCWVFQSGFRLGLELGWLEEEKKAVLGRSCGRTRRLQRSLALALLRP